MDREIIQQFFLYMDPSLLFPEYLECLFNLTAYSYRKFYKPRKRGTSQDAVYLHNLTNELPFSEK